MVFSSSVFTFVFLPLVLFCYFLPQKVFAKTSWRNGILLFGSAVFYAWGGVKALIILVILVLVNWLFARLMEWYPFYKKVFLTAAIGVCLINIIYFKYSNFLIENIQVFLSVVTGENISWNLREVALPIGISFFTFQVMSYSIDVYRGEVAVQKSPAKLLLYVMMFPQLIAGPIVRYKEINDEIECRKIKIDQIEQGIKRFIVGFSKKVFLANTMGSLADVAFASIDNLNTLYAWTGAICYSLQIYYDFSAYSDMAIGLGWVFGFHFNENFNYPYISKSIKEFWRRWHISLSSWFRDYVYIPLGGNRKGTGRTYFNLMVVFLLTGIWHGAAWQFLIWGIYHGLFLVLERVGGSIILEKLPGWCRHIYVGLVVIVGWVFFGLIR